MRIVMERGHTVLVLTKMNYSMLLRDNQFYQDTCVEMTIMLIKDSVWICLWMCFRQLPLKRMSI